MYLPHLVHQIWVVTALRRWHCVYLVYLTGSDTADAARQAGFASKNNHPGCVTTKPQLKNRHHHHHRHQQQQQPQQQQQHNGINDNNDDDEAVQKRSNNSMSPSNRLIALRRSVPTPQDPSAKPRAHAPRPAEDIIERLILSHRNGWALGFRV